MDQEAKDLLMRGATQLGVELTSAQLGKFALFAAELRKWNHKINLTAITTEREIALKHFVDSLSLCRAVGKGGRLLDLGSGGGFPVIPFAILHPKSEAVSVDAVEKKIIFQRHVGRLLGLSYFQAIHARGEELAGRFAGHFDWVVSRAFSDIPTFVHMALPLLAPSGTIIAMKGQAGREEAETSGPALEILGVEIRQVMEFPLPFSGDKRSLIVMGRKNAS
ncbi:16S rRNA (guanine(527)-N(7))-methyltransferase RsmG [Geobacter hydrogenophilus]|uniref:Ribosomal RNA small subunit methyltransferase G n=1 Tax=Geobacter hydrogenophilus TaxID=40983 RepID=A0A9W6FZK6_9BACT|nr:16S rRNA (guanine(527)-N(7))-methyltransferase RsmG [Geobacter hydrogenophilus]MBT0894039.1 16S rRNA (guanine(527)-N(7))-methyltransferase RsmG [Geobacter hydrogenophilus]GLI38014.1 ribosomal RNA small subunit methyltransferase G [Geobacter hydrogenophilus]